MSLGFGRLYNYVAGDYMRKNMIEGEFNNLIDLINLPPAHPWIWAHFVGDDTFMTATTKFPQWVTPNPNWVNATSGNIHLTYLLSYYRTRDVVPSTDGGYEVGIYVNEVLVRTVWLYTSSIGLRTAGQTSIGAPLDLAPGDVVRLGIISVIDASNQWKNVTLALFGNSDWWMSTGEPTIARILDPFGNTIEGTDWDAEFDNNVTFFNDAYFSATHSVFISGQPTVASKGAMFLAPSNWLNASLLRVSAIYHGGTASDTLSIDVIQNLVTNLETLSLDVTDPIDTVKTAENTFSVAAGDTMEFSISDASGTQEDVTITFEFVFQVQAAYTRAVATFATPPFLSADWKTEIDGEIAYVDADLPIFNYAAYWESPTTASDRNIAFICRQIQGAKVTALYGIFRGGSASGVTRMELKRNGHTLGNIQFSGAGDPIDTLKTNNITDVTLSLGDLLTWDMVTPTGLQEQVTAWVEIQAEPQPGG